MASHATTSATELLRQRHHEIEDLFTRTLGASGDERRELFDCLRATIAVHETTEEMFVHPLARRVGGDKAEGIVVVNNMRKRGRRLGADLWREARGLMPLTLIGMDAEAEGGMGEVRNVDVPAFIANYRFFFHTCRYTSLGLAACEAMMIGMPIVAPATTEVVTIVKNGVNGYVDTNKAALYDAMRELLRDRDMARRWGDAARETALRRFGIGRFVTDWMDTLAWYLDRFGERKAA
jgi:glycosyltransferase involved in cell wall biosynthesis